MSKTLSSYVEGKTLYVVSDLHMGDGTAKDNFTEHRTRFEEFLSGVVEQDSDGCLVLAGDVFEFWQSSHGSIAKMYFDLLRRLVERKSAFIVGNHDIDLFGFIGLPVDSPLIGCLAMEVVLKRGDRHIRICHGHEFDKFNDPRKAMLLGRIATMLAGEAEMRLGTKLGGVPTEKRLERIVRRIMAGFAWFYRNILNKTAGERTEKDKKVDETKVALDNYHPQHPDQTLVAGHTHKAGWYGDWYVNAGCWQTEQAHYVKITPDGEVSLHRWPGNEIEETKLWPVSATPSDPATG